MATYAFTTAEELKHLCTRENKSIAAIALAQAMIEHQMTKDQCLEGLAERLQVMKEAVQKGLAIVDRSESGLSGGDAQKIFIYEPKVPLLSPVVQRAVAYAVAVMEHNARYGKIVAFPTAGSSGIVPGVLLAYQDIFSLPDEVIINAMLVAGALGSITGANAMMAGATGGCQSEVGVSSAMAAAGLTEVRGGSPTMALDAAAITLKNMLGLVCDPIGGLVEAPCVKRNTAGVSLAFTASEMVMAGVKSNVSFDEVLAAMVNVAKLMASELRETAKGGLAITPTGRKVWSTVYGGVNK